MIENFEKLKKIKLLALDFDGVLTPAKVIVSANGEESVVCSHRDGQGIESIRKAGVPVVVISGQRSLYVEKRCNKMGIDFFQNIKDKPACLLAYLKEKHPSVAIEDVCFVGDDASDLAVMNIVGAPIAVADGTEEVKQRALLVTNRNGGEGAVREVCDIIIKAKSSDIDNHAFLKILITGTGERATEEVRMIAKNIAAVFGRNGDIILTNGGPNGVPEAAATGANEAGGHSVAYTFMPGRTTEYTKTKEIKSFPDYEQRNAYLCSDSDVAIFFQGGLGTATKFFTLLHRLVHINGELMKKGFPSLQRPKLMIVHSSFAPNDLIKCQELFGRNFKPEHFAAVHFADTAEEIIKIVDGWRGKDKTLTPEDFLL